MGANLNRLARFYQVRQTLVHFVGAKIADHYISGDLLICLADTDRAKKLMVARIAHNELADPMPQKEKTGVMSLIGGAYKRASQLDGRCQFPQKPGVKTKQTAGVKTFLAVRIHDLVGQAQSIGSGQLAMFVVP